MPEALSQALGALAPHGRCVFVGNHPADSSIPFDMNAMSNATLSGCNLGGGPPHELIDRIVRLHLAGRFPLERLVEVYPFGDIQRAIVDAKAGSVVKPVVTMD